MDPILFTRDAGTQLSSLLEEVEPSGRFLLVDRNTEKFCLDVLAPAAVPPSHLIRLEGGEGCKTLEGAARVWQHLSSCGARRNSVLICLGGGVVTDLGGFAASCFKRGMRFIHVPTTLLSQVDASVGGKTGVNFNGLKNEIGCFARPEAVLVDNRFLATLPQRQILSGFAEMLKHGFLSGNSQLEAVMGADLGRTAEEGFLSLIRDSVAVKAGFVEQDPREKGIRKALNFGHTVGHAIEEAAIAEGLELYHGEAVAYGMIAALRLSVRKCGFPEDLYGKAEAFIRSRYPTCPCTAGPERLYALMLHDKKNSRQGVNFSLLRAPGEVVTDCYCSREETDDALEQVWKGGRS